MRYDHPSLITEREESIETVVGAAGVNARFARTQKLRLNSVSMVVVTAGTSTANNCIVKAGTNTLGTLVTGTQAAETLIKKDIGADVPAGAQITVVNGADTLFKGIVIYNYNFQA